MALSEVKQIKTIKVIIRLKFASFLLFLSYCLNGCFPFSFQMFVLLPYPTNDLPASSQNVLSSVVLFLWGYNSRSSRD